MKIDPNQYPAGIQPGGVQNSRSRGPEQSESGTVGSDQLSSGDTVQLSGTLNQLQQLKANLAQMPDVRAERVAALQRKIQQGQYKPSNEQIAGAMVSDLFGKSARS